ncbi:TIGR03905 family protein [Deltaproteobacteria bacterium Smac51]|nr:TIGR03905 family protein [Deltaproteobacteria bacterium Smac51]
MRHSFSTKGTCSRSIEFDVNDGIVSGITFEGGCHGNLQGVAKLAEGRSVEELVSILSGIKCDTKKTSCPDQLAKALKKHTPKKKGKSQQFSK